MLSSDTILRLRNAPYNIANLIDNEAFDLTLYNIRILLKGYSSSLRDY
jgi:hypothetical protein